LKESAAPAVDVLQAVITRTTRPAAERSRRLRSPSRAPRRRARDADMKTYQGTMTPNRRDLSDPRSSGKPVQTPRAPLLNDRRSTR